MTVKGKKRTKWRTNKVAGTYHHRPLGEKNVVPQPERSSHTYLFRALQWTAVDLLKANICYIRKIRKLYFEKNQIQVLTIFIFIYS